MLILYILIFFLSGPLTLGLWAYIADLDYIEALDPWATGQLIQDRSTRQKFSEHGGLEVQ